MNQSLSFSYGRLADFGYDTQVENRSINYSKYIM